MGCTGSKEERPAAGGANEAAVDGGAKKVAGESAPPPVDKRLPFDSYRSLFTFKNYWKAISRAATKSGNLLLQRFLKTNPEIQELYPRLKSLNFNNDECTENTAFETTAGQYLAVFDDTVTDIDGNEVDKAIKRLKNVGKNHKKIASCNADLFQKLEQPFLFMVSEALQDRYNDKCETLFRNFFQFCLKYILEGFNE